VDRTIVAFHGMSGRFGETGAMRRKRKSKSRERADPGPQAPAGAWSPSRLKEALAQGTPEEKVALLKEIGILNEKGELGMRYRNWGAKVSRASDDAAAGG